MTVNAEDSLRKHLDAVDRLERRFWRTSAFAAVVAVFSYGSFFYLNGKGADIRLILDFVVVTNAIGTALISNVLHYRMTSLANTILKAVELSAREPRS